MVLLEDHEFNVLCEIARIKELPLYDFAILTPEQKDGAIEQLKEKGYLLEDGFSEDIKLVFSLINSYIDAKHYFTMNNGAYAYIDDEKFIMIVKNDLESVAIGTITRNIVITFLLTSLNHLEEIESKPRKMLTKPEDEVANVFENLEEDSTYHSLALYFREGAELVGKASYIMYVADGYLNIYQFNTKKMVLVGLNDMSIELEEILTINKGERTCQRRVS